MPRAGFHHIGLVTLKPEETIEFYTEKLGWTIAVNDIIRPLGGGEMRHIFFDTGDGSFLAFLAPVGVPGVAAEFETSLNGPVGLPQGFYHLAMWADNVDALKAKREFLLDRGVDVTPVLDHDFAASIYFTDPNGVQLEYCATARELTEADRDLSSISKPGAMVDDPEVARQMAEMLMGSAAISFTGEE